VKKILLLLSLIPLISCSKPEPCPKIESPIVKEEVKNSEDLEKRIKDTKQICNNMKNQLENLKYNPEPYMKYSSEYIKVCGVVK
jgi:hypothetical protein